jgi:catechol 2,3-dioxygenase-like lactoylglutathione lyase family enzyme
MPLRPLDHLVMPVTDIATARARLTALGFTVAADARHPFGTENACVFFSDGAYLEPLGIASEPECRQTAAAGNQFTARNNAFRLRNGPEGLSAIVLGSTDAVADDAAFRAKGISGGDILEFSRVMKLPDGTEITPTFRLAFAADPASPDFHGITCQRINVPAVDRSALERHPNSVTGIRTVILAAPDPAGSEAFLSALVGGQASVAEGRGLTLATANSQIDVVDAEGTRDFPLLEFDDAPGLRGRMILFSVVDLTVTETHLAAHGIAFSKHNQTLFVPHQQGQGVPFAFSE